ncbi:MAG: hemolysin family protein [Myxococcota bacterium]
MIGLLLFTAFLIFANGFFVAAEFGLVKVRSTQLEVSAAEGNRLAGVARGMLDHLDSYLSATQLGITLTSLGLGWVGEPAVAAALGPLFALTPLSEEAVHSVSMVIGFGLISFLHIVLGEVAPKSLAIARPVTTSTIVAGPMRVFHWLFYPPLIVLNAASNGVLRLFGVEPAGTHSLAVHGDELVRIVEESAAGGTISVGEGEMVSNVFAFSHRVAREIMVPRNRVHGIDLLEPIEPQLADALEQGHSRCPVYEGDLDAVVGMLHLKDLLKQDVASISQVELRKMLRQPLFVPESLRAEKVMRRMQARRTHLAVVVDEHGGVAGVVSLEDALEELVGDIQDEYDEELQDVQPIDGGFALSGSVLLEDLAPLLQIRVPDSDSDTLQGWLMEHLERIPRPGDRLVLDGWRFDVVEVEQRTVTRAEAHPAAPEAPPPLPDDLA